MKRLMKLATALMMMMALGVAGCTGQSAVQSPTEPPAVEEGVSQHQHDAGDMEKMRAELAKLSPEDAASAEKQHVCPVTGAMLGTMGAPIKVEVEGGSVWICCESCRDDVLADPDKYLAIAADAQKA